MGRALCLINTHDVELANRMRKAWAKFGIYKDELTDKAIPLNLRLKLFHSVVTPSAMYGCGSWVMTGTRKATLQSTHLKMLRAILAQKRVLDSDGVLEPWVDWAQRSSRDARHAIQQLNIPDWTTELHAKLVSWRRRLSNMDSQRWARKVLEWRPIGRRSRGHPLTRWNEQQ